MKIESITPSHYQQNKQSALFLLALLSGDSKVLVLRLSIAPFRKDVRSEDYIGL